MAKTNVSEILGKDASFLLDHISKTISKNNSILIESSKLPNGIYYVEIAVDKKMFYKKLIVTK